MSLRTRVRSSVVAVLAVSATLSLSVPASAQLVDVDTLPGGRLCQGDWLINDQGALVGSCRDSTGSFVAVHQPDGASAPVVLPTLAPDLPCDVVALSAAGVMAGNCKHGSAGEWGPVRWQGASPPQLLATAFGHVSAKAVAVNAHGAIVGMGTDEDGTAHGVVWLPGTTAALVLPGPGLLQLATTECAMSALNDVAPRPVVVGACHLDAGGVVAVRWTYAGLLAGYEPAILDRPTGGTNCFPIAVNSAGQVAGTCEGPTGTTLATVWRPGNVDPIFLAGPLNTAVAMNDAGLVVGNYFTADGFMRGFTWQAGIDVPAQDVGGLGGFWTEVAGVANDGTVTGSAQSGTGTTHAFVLPPESSIVDLGTLGGFNSNAHHISPGGCIVGLSEMNDGLTHAFRTTCASTGVAASRQPVGVGSRLVMVLLSYSQNNPRLQQHTYRNVASELGAIVEGTFSGDVCAVVSQVLKDATRPSVRVGFLSTANQVRKLAGC